VRTAIQTLASRIVASTTIVTAALGVLYSLSSLQGTIANRTGATDDLPYFHLIYLLKLAIWTTLYCLLIWHSCRLWRGLPGSGRIVSRLLLLEVAFLLLISFLWLTPVIGRSIGAATGIAGGGAMAQFLVLLPLWGPLLLWTTGSNRDEPAGCEFKPETQVARVG
jgi:tryptophan-rich sensory protein